MLVSAATHSNVFDQVATGFTVYAVVLNTGLLLLTLLALYEFANYRRRLTFAGYDETFGDPIARAVSVVIPAYNEGESIVSTVQAMMALRYPEFEVVVVDDGSTDDTAAVLIETFSMVRAPLVVAEAIPLVGQVEETWISPRGGFNLVLVRKTHGGKADALNTGVNIARKELICMVDADSVLDPDALLHVARPFADDPERVVASGGVVRVADGCQIREGRVVEVAMPRTRLGRIQVVEYLRSFMVGRAGWSSVGGLIVISGTFGLVRKDLLFALGGLATDCATEDAELVVRLRRWLADHSRAGRVAFVSEPVAWTRTPASSERLGAQRRRWHRGLSEVLWRHRGMLLRPRYGAAGLVTMPWYWVFELLGSLIELLGSAFLAISLLAGGAHLVAGTPTLVDGDSLALLVIAWMVYPLVLSLVALLAEEVSYRRYLGVPDLLRAVWGALEEQVGYRQQTAWWRLQGTLAAMRGGPVVWGGGRPAVAGRRRGGHA